MMLKRERLVGKLVYLDRDLTLSARSSVATGELAWETEYQRQRNELVSTIQDAETVRLPGDCIDQIVTARGKLAEMEKKVFRIVHAGQLDSAAGILRGSEYEEQKILYQKGTNCFMENTLRHYERSHSEHVNGELRILFYATPALLFAVISVVFVFRQYSRKAELAREELLENEERFRWISETVDDVFWIADVKISKMLYISPAYERIWGKTRESLVDNPKSFIDSILDEDKGRVLADLELEKVGKPFDHEYRIIRPDGAVRWISDRGYPVRANDGQVGCYTGIARDITERKKLEDEILRRERKHVLLFESSRDALTIVAPPAWKFTGANQAALQLFGVPSVAEFITLSPWELSPELQPDGRLSSEKSAELISKAMHEGFHFFEWEHRRLDGKPFRADVLLTRMEVGEEVFLQATVRNISERKKTENELIYLKKILGLLHEISKIFIMIHDDEVYGEVLELILIEMESCCGVFGYLNEIGDLIVPSMTRDVWVKCQVSDKNIVFPKDTWGDSSWPRALREKKANYSNEQSTKVTEGHIPMFRHISMPIVYQGESIGLIQVSNKKTDYNENDMSKLQSIADHLGPILHSRLQKQFAEKKLKSVELQLMLSEKLAGIGQLSAGVCHEILNPLNIISIQTQLLLRREEDSPDLRRRLTKIRSEIGRIEKIVGLLMTFARKGISEFAPVQINAELDSVLSLVEKDFNLDNIKIIRDWQSPLPEVKADMDELRQVFLNLVNNARYEMRSGGTLTVKTRLEKIGGRDHARICFSDTGTGIKKVHLTKIFDPFFTTKPEGLGTGMGLSIAHSIVEKHGGTLRAESEEGEGAAFIIDLPVKPG